MDAQHSLEATPMGNSSRTRSRLTRARRGHRIPRHTVNGLYLEVTFRDGRAFAAYLHLPRRGGLRSVRTRRMPPGLIVDFAVDGGAIGIEITAPRRVTAASLNRVLGSLGAERVTPVDLAPLRAA